VLLAWKLWKHGALGNFDPYQMIRRACGFLVREGPVTAQDRWEEASGYSPSTLAVHIAALICAAEFFEDRGDHGTADFARNYADFLESHIEQWTVTTQGTLLPGVSRHYIRINPVASVDCADEDPNCGVLTLQNQAPGARYQFPAKEIVDAGFLELVRYGIRSAEDPIIEDSVKVIDAVLKVETPYGPCWRRYNRDGYGQRDDGTSYDGWGTGRAWPLLTGERGHYEIAAGRDPGPYLRALENAQGIGLIPEQIWDSPDIPARQGKQSAVRIDSLKLVNDYIARKGMDAPAEEIPQLRDCYEQAEATELDLNEIGGHDRFPHCRPVLCKPKAGEIAIRFG
jgi:glucoamylase